VSQTNNKVIGLSIPDIFASDAIKSVFACYRSHSDSVSAKPE